MVVGNLRPEEVFICENLIVYLSLEREIEMELRVVEEKLWRLPKGIIERTHLLCELLCH